MISYELLPHEYSYALYLSYAYDLHPYDSMILNNKISVRCLVLKIPCLHPYDLQEVHQQLDHTQKLYSEHLGEDRPVENV